MQKIYNYSKETLGVVHEKEIKVGDIFEDGYNAVEKRPIFKEVVKIHEQRKERGSYEDETRRRQWGKVDVLTVPNSPI